MDEPLTIRDLYNFLDKRMGRIEDAVVDLTKAANHRFEAFERALEQKADRSDLLPTTAGQVLRSKLFWSVFAGLTIILGPVVVDHWHLLIDRF